MYEKQRQRIRICVKNGKGEAGILEVLTIACDDDGFVYQVNRFMFTRLWSLLPQS